MIRTGKLGAGGVTCDQVFDVENRLVQVRSGGTVLNNFGYDHTGQRIYTEVPNVASQRTITL